jgi:hypothetical protein
MQQAVGTTSSRSRGGIMLRLCSSVNSLSRDGLKRVCRPDSCSVLHEKDLREWASPRV